MIFAKKSLGQNFLIDKNITKKIINLSKVTNQNIIEIGPGKGALTEEILKRKPKSLKLIEKDFILANKLKSKYINTRVIKIYNEDILRFNIEKIIKKDTIIFGNLPYNISSQILVKFLKFRNWPPKYNNLIFMFQKELGEKIISHKGRVLVVRDNMMYEIIEDSLKLLSIKTTQISIQDLQVFEDFLYIYDRKNVHSFVVQKPKK